MRFTLILTCFISLFFAACSSTKKTAGTTPEKVENPYPMTVEEISALNNTMEKAYYTMIGNFSNKRQADTASSPYCKGQILKSIPIWDHKNYWLCMGWFSESVPDQPIASGVFHIIEYKKDTFQLDFYDLPADADMVAVWKDEIPLEKYAPDDLKLRSGCSSSLIYKGNGSFEISNDESPCFKDISAHMKYFDMNATFSAGQQVHANVFYNGDKKVSMAYPKIYYDRIEPQPETEASN